MKLRNHICLATLLGMALTFLCFGNSALGQSLQPPFMAPTPPSLTYGVFYFSAGAKYRNVDTFRMDVAGGPRTITVNPGTIPFGPTSAGAFGVGTGKDGFLGAAGGPPFTWTYDNGAIFTTPNPGGIVVQCTNAGPPITTSTCTPADAPFTYSVTTPLLGREVVLITSTNCCNGTTVPAEVGSFSIVDPRHQVDNPGSIAGSTTVTFSLALSDSLGFLTDTTPDFNRVFQAAVVGPSLEMGYQFSNFFDLFTGFSWFNVSNSMVLSNVLQGQGTRTTIVDTFPFLSDDASAWPIFNFNSSDTIVGGTANHFYQIAPNGPGNGVQPTRQFSVGVDASIPPEGIQETISNTANFNTFETRFGARSWAPLWGLGRIGATLGTAIIPTWYKISGSRSYTALNTAGSVVQGQILFTDVSFQEDWRTLYGGFVGGDLSVGNTGYFLYGSADYMWANSLSYELGAVKTTFNPGGFTAGLSAGVQF